MTSHTTLKPHTSNIKHAIINMIINYNIIVVLDAENPWFLQLYFLLHEHGSYFWNYLANLTFAQ